MKAIEFEQQTVVLAKDQPEYNNLPVHITNDAERQMISCYELTDEEFKIITETKKIWHGQCTFGKHYHPTWLSVQNPFIGKEPSTSKKENMSITEAAKNYGNFPARMQNQKFRHFLLPQFHNQDQN